MNTIAPYKTVTSILKKYETEGHSPYLVLTNDFEKYILKTPNNINDISSLIKEFLCNNILKVWGVPVPEAIGLTLHSELDANDHIIKDKTFKYANVFFGLQYIDYATDFQQFISAEKKVSSKKILNNNQLFEIALFDIWVENDDRKPSNNNLLLCPKAKELEIIPIDHAFTFATLQFKDLIYNEVSFSDNDSILYTAFGKSLIKKQKINKEWFTRAKEMFYICISKTEENFEHIVNKIPSEFGLTHSETINLRRFLFNEERNKIVFEQFCYIISNIKK